MKAIELINLILVCVENRWPILLKGAPGVGKSDVVAQACKLAKADLMIKHPSIEDPTDPKGMPCMVDGKAVFLPYGDMMRMMTAKRPLVVFLDDLGQAAGAVQAAYMQLLLARQLGGKQISEHVTFVAATNRREDRAGVTGILEPVKSRFFTIAELTPDAESWRAWAREHGVSREMIGFIGMHPELLFDTGRPTNDIVNRPCPRTVFFMDKLFQKGVRSLEALAGSVGEAFATQFLGFIRVWESLPSIETIFRLPKEAKVPTEIATLSVLARALAARLDKDNAKAFFTYIDRLPEEFGALAMRDGVAQCPDAQRCREYAVYVSRHPNVLV